MARPDVGLAFSDAASGTGVAATCRFGHSHSEATKPAISMAPMANTVSPGTRIHTSMWISGRSMNSAERANQ